jgi:hypothetical protein
MEIVEIDANCSVGEGLTRRVVAREFGLAREKLSKMLEYSAPPGQQRQRSR